MSTTGQESSVSPATSNQACAIWLEVVGLYLATLLLIKAVVFAQETFSLPPDVLVVVPILFIYAPLLLLRHKGVDPHDFGLTLEGLVPALRLNALLVLAILVPFAIGNHFFQAWAWGRSPVGQFPNNFLSEVLLYHLLFVGLPEEFFYRGYVQSRLGQIMPQRWTILGVKVGPSLLWTAALFTVGHSIVTLRWWHFSIIGPALAFGWIRERTGNVVACAIFHGLCNVLMVTLDTYYGVILP